MKLLLFAYEIPPLGGGVATAVENLLRSWQEEKNLKILLITSSLDNTFYTRQISTNTTAVFVPIGVKNASNIHKQNVNNLFKYTFWSCLMGLYYRFKFKPSISLSFGYPGPVASWLLWWTGVPFVVALRGVEVPGYNARFSWAFWLQVLFCKITWPFAKKITANSSWLASKANRFTSKSITIIPNGVDVKTFKPAKKQSKSFLVTAGGTVMGKKKNLDVLIHGFAQFLQKKQLSPNQAKLVLIGDGDQRQELQQKVSQLKIDAYVDFLGSQSKEELAQTLPHCSLFCLPSQAEGMSNAALEAMAAGLPTILSKVGAAEEIVDGNGVILATVSAETVANAIEFYFQNPQHRKLAGLKSREIAKKFTWQQMADSYLAVLK